MLKKIHLVPLLLLALIVCACAVMAISAQEYYAIGMAYFELGKFEEAEKWLGRAAQADRTMTASKYNLGRLAFESQRYEEAAKHFEDILKRDKDNTLALKAAAYTRIKTGDISIAEKHYNRLLELVPESSDDGYNHALVLYAMGRYGAAEEVLKKYPFAVQENKDAHLLYARSQAAQKKVEAIDNFANWLTFNSDPKVRYEYAQTLEYHEFYARALEEYRKTISEITAATEDPKKSDVRFALAKALLIAEGESGEGITEMHGAVEDGFNNIEAIEKLLESDKVSRTNKNSLNTIYENLKRAVIEKKEQEELAKQRELEEQLERDKSADTLSESETQGSSN